MIRHGKVPDLTADRCRPSGTKALLERPNPRKGDVCGRTSESAHVEDGVLVERVKQGQTEAYGELVRRYQDRVFNACWRIYGRVAQVLWTWGSR